MEEILKLINPFYLLQVKERSITEEFILIVYFILSLVVIYKTFVTIVDRVRPPADNSVRYNRRRLTRILFVLVGAISLLPIIFSGLAYLPTVMGLAGAGIVISLKDITLNYVGWFLIHGSNGFEVGDRIELDGIKGDVVNIGINRFTLMELSPDPKSEQSTNRLVHFPNHSVILHKVYVVKEKLGFVWDEFRLKLPYGSDWEAAEKILNGILHNGSVIDQHKIDYSVRELSKNYLVRLGKTSPIIYVNIEEGGILFSLRYLTHIKEKRNQKARISREVLKEFADAGIRLL
ncbi:mechanosensitive ion channel family protein [Leptospira wolffii]|uniref:Mechanosensitive ion channel family protein n=1 Tax=Leptospira wolffii TaxID=409998 RepID=A0A2M9Z828_9LEPT|nr:mechanosensitive ion channel domain-containing protein [Leptospira wolffii]EPG68155.1 transporter, small conductance mechanosensitive ion channel MscS family protein [Leptospira wolffii serovar Khorat str. Khorat-H2]PJZ64570.1 mechanosensitive ion channel protein [Leptospira wolffii]TGK55183.1 mechanosensitive ion channel protein [Leptospira wolffii]TGK70516.1 mechanosensitive ion channel protein [Leptospira wolffii]TGK77636.1 mechanosensitive ion channel protein [Leptospira wolffii]